MKYVKYPYSYLYASAYFTTIFFHVSRFLSTQPLDFGFHNDFPNGSLLLLKCFYCSTTRFVCTTFPSGKSSNNKNAFPNKQIGTCYLLRLCPPPPCSVCEHGNMANTTRDSRFKPSINNFADDDGNYYGPYCT